MTALSEIMRAKAITIRSTLFLTRDLLVNEGVRDEMKLQGTCHGPVAIVGGRLGNDASDLPATSFQLVRIAVASLATLLPRRKGILVGKELL
jgi:hypothetical protein